MGLSSLWTDGFLYDERIDFLIPVASKYQTFDYIEYGVLPDEVTP